MAEKKLTIGLDDLTPLKADFKKAVCVRSEVFRYKGAEVLTAYAPYLIDYLEGVRRSTKKKG